MKKFICIVFVITTLFVFTIPCFGLSSVNKPHGLSYVGFTNTSAMEVVYSDYQMTLDYPSEFEEDITVEQKNYRRILTDALVLPEYITFKSTVLAQGEMEYGVTKTIEMPSFRTVYTGEVFSSITYGTNEFGVDIVMYDDTTVYASGWKDFAYQQIQINQGTFAISAVHRDFFEFNTTTGIINGGNKGVSGVFSTIYDGDKAKGIQSYDMNKTFATGQGNPVIFSFESKNVVLYPNQDDWNGQADDPLISILPSFELPSADYYDESQAYPYGWEQRTFVTYDVRYTYFYKSSTSTGEYKVEQFEGEQSITGTMIDGRIAFIVPPVSYFMSEGVYDNCVAFVYESIVTRVHTSAWLNNMTVKVHNTGMRGDLLSERELSELIKNVRYYPTEQLRFSDLSVFLTNVSDGFFNTRIFGLFSISDILFTIIGIALVVVFLKIFAGG